MQDDLIQDRSAKISKGKNMRPDPHQPLLASDQSAEEQIRARAHALWEAEGQPADRAEAHWLQAEQELAGTSDYVMEAAAAKPAGRKRAKANGAG